MQKLCFEGRSTRPESSHSRLQGETEGFQSTQQSPQAQNDKEVSRQRNSLPKTDQRKNTIRDNKMKPRELYQQNQQF